MHRFRGGTCLRVLLISWRWQLSSVGGPSLMNWRRQQSSVGGHSLINRRRQLLSVGRPSLINWRRLAGLAQGGVVGKKYCPIG